MRSGLYLIATGLLILGIGIGIGVERHWTEQSTNDGSTLPAGESALKHARKHLDPEYACPMHAEIVSKDPGSCPVCGMDLVKREPAAQPETAADRLPEVLVPPGFITTSVYARHR
jgi:Cu(I)/Ag(I) efflux system membrane fusion protein